MYSRQPNAAYQACPTRTGLSGNDNKAAFPPDAS